MQAPILFIFNTLQPFHRQFQSSHLNRMVSFMTDQLNSHNQKFIMMPIVNSQTRDILDRSTQIEQQIAPLLKEGPIHIIASGISGLDARPVYNNHQNILSLATLASPHKGAYFSQIVQHQKMKPETLIPLEVLIGMDIQNLKEITPSNMQHFNLDHPATKTVYSFGATEHPNQSAEVLKLTNFFIRNEVKKHTVSHNDGLFQPDEVEFSHSMGTYHMDHSCLIGMTDSFPHFQMAIDNAIQVETELL